MRNIHALSVVALALAACTTPKLPSSKADSTSAALDADTASAEFPPDSVYEAEDARLDSILDARAKP